MRPDAAGRAVFSYRVLLAFGLVTLYLLTIDNRFNDPDLWFHLRLGQHIANTWSIPTSELFSHTAYGHPWIPHEWLAQLGLYAAHQFGGYTGLMLCFSAIGSLLFVLVYVLCYRQSGNSLAALLGGVCVWFFGTVGFSLRPHLVGYTLLAAELLLLDLAVRRPRWHWALPPLFAIWVNCHGSYYFGIGVLAVWWICEARSRTLVVVLCGLALCCNPEGFRLLSYPFDLAMRQPVMVGNVEEWQPPEWSDSRGWGMIGLAVGIVWMLWRRKQLRLVDLLLLGAASVLAARYVRMLFVFGIVAGPLLARAIGPVLARDRERQHPAAIGGLMAAFAAAVVLFFPAAGELQAQVRRQMPVAAVEYVRRAGLRGPMFNQHVFGGYLMWALPEHKTFVDGRGDVFDWTGVLKEYGQAVTLAEDPNIVLSKYGVEWCLLSKRSPLAKLPGWQQVYADDVALVLVRSTPDRSVANGAD